MLNNESTRYQDYSSKYVIQKVRIDGSCLQKVLLNVLEGRGREAIGILVGFYSEKDACLCIKDSTEIELPNFSTEHIQNKLRQSNLGHVMEQYSFR